MRYPSAEDPDRSHATEPPAAAEPTETAGTDGADAPADPGTAALSEKPVLEWTTEDWARWIEEPALPTRPSVEANALEDAEEPDQVGPAVPETMKMEGDPTGTWSLALEEDDEDAKWWSSVAGLPDIAAPELPAPAEEPPPLIPPPPVVPPPLPLTPGAAAPPAPLPPITPPLSESEPPRRPAQHAPTAPIDAATPSRSPQARRMSLDPADNMAVRVRAGFSLLGVSVLMGAVAAGLITVAIFMASVVLRRALG